MKLVYVDNLNNENTDQLKALAKALHLRFQHVTCPKLTTQGLRQDALYLINYEYWHSQRDAFHLLVSDGPDFSSFLFNAPESLPPIYT